MQTHWNLGRRVAAAVLAAVSLTLVATTAAAQASDAYSHDSSTGASNADWMGKLSGDAYLSGLSIPGTHDTGASKAGGDIGLTQSMDLATQLNAGIRAWDIRLGNNGGQLTIWHGSSHQGNQNFDGDVLGVASSFLAAHPTETILMRVGCEHGSCDGFDAAVDAVLARYPIASYYADVPQLKDVRGKIVVLQDGYKTNTSGRLEWHDVDIQDSYYLEDNWQLAWKWWQIKLKLNDAQNATATDKLYANYLSGSGRSFPYFVAGGLSSPQTDAPALMTGMTRGVLDSCSADWHCIDEFPSVSCFAGTCSVAFAGTNTLAMNEINRRGAPNHYGLVYADFPGKGLIKAIINANFPRASSIQGLISRRCVDVPGSSQTSGTAVSLYDCNGTDAQRFVPDNGTLKVFGKCLQPRGGITADGMPVEIAECNGSDVQRWKVNGGATIVNLKSTTCLDASGGGTGNRTPLIIWPCNGGLNQRWVLSQGPRLM